MVKYGGKVVAHPLSMIINYADALNKEYADILDYLHQNIPEGDIIALEQYIKNKVNGSFTKIIKDFIREYEGFKDHRD